MLGLFPSTPSANPLGRVYLSDCSAHAIATGTAEVVLKTFSITAANVSIPANSVIVVRTLWTFTNSSNAKSLRVRIGAAGAGLTGTQVLNITATTTATTARDVVLYVRSTSSQLSVSTGALTHEASNANAIQTAAIDLTANWEIAITGQPATNGETVQLEAASLEIVVP